jgi:hypothetical protein
MRKPALGVRSRKHPLRLKCSQLQSLKIILRSTGVNGKGFSFCEKNAFDVSFVPRAKHMNPIEKM